MSQCHITFLTSTFKLLHGSASNFVWIFLVNLYKIAEIKYHSLMEFWAILCTFYPIL